MLRFRTRGISKRRCSNIPPLRAMPMFSRRLPPHADLNALTRAVARVRASGAAIVDLTESNPTRAGIAYPPDLLRGLADEDALRYEPHAFGLPSAREAVARDHMRRG